MSTCNLISQAGGGGNLVTGDSYYREYNGLGQLKSVKEGNTSSGRVLEEYFYDANGDRIRVNRYSYTGGFNETIYTPYREWMQVRNSSGTFNFYYIYQGDTLVARQKPDGTKWFYHADHLGSTTLISDQNGNVVEDEFYSPFGESLTTNNAEKNKLYTGQFKDTTGQYYFGARYYLVNPPIFISGDPIIQQVYDPQFLNHYAYSRNNPYRLIDVDGREVYVIVKETERIPLTDIGEPGHIAFAVRDPDRGGYRFYSDEGPSTSDTGIKFLFNVGFTKKYTSEYAVDVGDTFEEVMPSEYYDSFRIETIEDQDRQIIDKANEIIWYSNPQEYNAFVRNSQDFVIESLAAGDVDLERRGPVPSWTYKFNKKKFEDENVRNNQQKEVEKTKSTSLGGSGGRGGGSYCRGTCTYGPGVSSWEAKYGKNKKTSKK